MVRVTVQKLNTYILDDCLAYEVLRNPEEWLGTPSPQGVQAFIAGAEDRAGFLGLGLPEWRIAGPLNQAEFDAPLLELTGHPTLSIRWPAALELIHYFAKDAMTDLRSRVEAWASGFDPDSCFPTHYSRPAATFRELLGHVALRPAMFFGRTSSWLLYCYLNGLERGGDWLGLPPFPDASEIISELQERSREHYGSRFGAFRVYENSPAELLAWVGITPAPRTIEVPRLATHPDTSMTGGYCTLLPDYLLTVLLGHSAGLLHADFSQGGEWRVRGWTSDALGPDEVIATTARRGMFRAVLARFGLRYMKNQVYGGYSEGRLTQEGRAFHFALYMANDQWRGYWLRVYTRTCQQVTSAEYGRRYAAEIANEKRPHPGPPP